MYLMKTEDGTYTLKKVDTTGKPTASAHPARFSPDDKFSRHRVTIKKRFGTLARRIGLPPWARSIRLSLPVCHLFLMDMAAATSLLVRCWSAVSRLFLPRFIAVSDWSRGLCWTPCWLVFSFLPVGPPVLR